MDKIGGWEDEEDQEKWVGARFAASMWIYSQAVVCNGERHKQTVRVNKMNSIWCVCVDLLEDHVRVSEFSLALQERKVLEAFHLDIDVPCIVQWRMLWYSEPTSLNNDLLNDGVIFEREMKP